MQKTCNHPGWILLQPWEYVRKYMCAACSEIAICECDREFAAKLPHQADMVRPFFNPNLELKVTLGFLPWVCASCRGHEEQPHVRADGYGSPSLLERYYWREIAREAYRLYEGTGFPPKKVWKAAKANIREAHRKNPRYDLKAHERGRPPTALEVMTAAGQRTIEDGVGRWRLDDKLVRAEVFAAGWLESMGWQVLNSESHLPRSLFGAFMAIVVQDSLDSHLTVHGFGKRDFTGNLIHMMMSPDHHSPAWYRRRQQAIHEHIESLPVDDLIWLLDYWWVAFSEHREYLWAHKPEYKDLAYRFLQLVPAKLPEVLLYLSEDFWRHSAGWPDLMGWRDDELRFFEVKSPNDRLSEDQIRWLNDNQRRLGFNVSLIRIKA